MIGTDVSAGRPFSPWHAEQSAAFSSIESAQAAVAPNQERGQNEVTQHAVILSRAKHRAHLRAGCHKVK